MEHQPKDDDDVKTETSPDMYELVQGVEPDPTYAEYDDAIVTSKGQFIIAFHFIAEFKATSARPVKILEQRTSKRSFGYAKSSSTRTRLLIH